MIYGMLQNSADEDDSRLLSQEESSLQSVDDMESGSESPDELSVLLDSSIPAKTKQLHPYHWNDCDIEKVSSLPFDISGKRVYELEWDPEKNPVPGQLIKDGRPWKHSIHLGKRKDFTGRRYKFACAMCESELQVSD